MSTSTVALLEESTKKKTKSVKKAELDQILDASNEFENLTQEKAEELAAELADTEKHNEFRLGGVFSVIRSKQWFAGYPNFGAYTSEKYGIEYRKAMYYIEIYDHLVAQQIPWSKVSDLKWTKVSILVSGKNPVLTLENVDEWVAKALPVNCETLKEMVKAAKGGAGTEEDKEKISTNVTTMTFKIKDDQKDVIKEALEKAKAETQTEFDNVALTNICTGYTGGSIAVSTTPAALKEQMKAAGYLQVLNFFEELWPTIDLKVGLPEEAEPAQEAA